MEGYAPRVTALITNYNHGQYLRAAIDSAVKQTYPNVEVLVVDDGSTDHSREIIAGYGTSIRAILTENGGQAAAFNVGIAEAQGEVICLLDSDDWWDPTKIAKVVMDGFCGRRDVALVYHRNLYVDADGRDRGMSPQPKYLSQGHMTRMLAKSAGWWAYPPTTALSFRTELLRQLAPIPTETFRICADAYLAGAAPWFGRVVAIGETLGFYRLHDTNNWNHVKRLGGDIAALNESAMQYRLRLESLNQTIERFGLGPQVSLEDHWPYWRACALTGDGLPWTTLARMALTFRGEPRKLARVKALAVSTPALIRSSRSAGQRRRERGG
jgi:glycosyltransferase involved in cell wall biosynthesis